MIIHAHIALVCVWGGGCSIAGVHFPTQRGRTAPSWDVGAVLHAGAPRDIVLGQLVKDNHTYLTAELAKLKTAVAAMQDTVPDNVCRRLNEEFRIEGVQALRTRDLEALLKESEARIMAACRRAAPQAPDPAQAPPPQGQRYAGGRLQPDGYRVWAWPDGSLRMVPQGFVMPSCNVAHLFNIWVMGNHTEQIQPYRHLKSADFVFVTSDPGVRKKQSKNMQIDFTKATKTIEALLGNCSTPLADLRSLAADARNELFLKAFDVWAGRFNPREPRRRNAARRLAEMNWKTFYFSMTKWKKEQRGGS